MKNYDPKQHTLVIAGIPIPMDGLADGEFIRVERATQLFTMKKGTDGSVTRCRQHDKTATCTFNTMQKADINSVLSALMQVDLNSANGAGVGPFLLKDNQGLTVYEAPHCWIAKPPDPSLDREATTRAWQIDIADLEVFEGG